MTQGLLSSLRIDLELRKSRLPRVGGNTVNRFPWIVFLFVYLFIFLRWEGNTVDHVSLDGDRREEEDGHDEVKKEEEKLFGCNPPNSNLSSTEFVFKEQRAPENVPGGGAPSALVAPPALEEHQQARCP